jgi:hypothetical protein
LYKTIRKKYFNLTQHELQSKHATDNNSINSHVGDCCSAEGKGMQFEIHKPERQHLQKSPVLGTYHTVRKFGYPAVTVYKICNYFGKNCIYKLYYKIQLITENITRAVIK